MWEVDETNNAWNKSYTAPQSGFGSATLVAGGGISVALLAGIVLLLRRKKPLEITQFPTADAPSKTVAKPLSGPPQRSATPKPKPSGLKGPPPRQASEPAAEPVDGAKALDSLIQVQPDSVELSVGSSVEEWSQLPPGGEYDYAMDQTVYKGEACGIWRMNEDKTFTRIE